MRMSSADVLFRSFELNWIEFTWSHRSEVIKRDKVINFHFIFFRSFVLLILGRPWIVQKTNLIVVAPSLSSQLIREFQTSRQSWQQIQIFRLQQHQILRIQTRTNSPLYRLKAHARQSEGERGRQQAVAATECTCAEWIAMMQSIKGLHFYASAIFVTLILCDTIGSTFSLSAHTAHTSDFTEHADYTPIELNTFNSDELQSPTRADKLFSDFESSINDVHEAADDLFNLKETVKSFPPKQLLPAQNWSWSCSFISEFGEIGWFQWSGHGISSLDSPREIADRRQWNW